MKTALLVAALLLPACVAFADEPSAAERHHQAGIAYYSSQRFKEAAESFRLSYELSGQPEILHNLSMCYERLGDFEKAITYEERYGVVASDPSERQQSAARVTTLRAQLVTQPAVLVPAPTTPAAPVRSARSPVGLGLTVAGGVLLAGGIVGLGVGGSTVKTINAGYLTLAEYDHLRSQAQVSLGVGGALSVVGVGCLVGEVVVMFRAPSRTSVTE